MTKERTPLRALRELLLALDARIDRHPAYADLRNLRGLARAHAGDLDGAFTDLGQALRVNPQYEAALLNVAWLHAERREPELVHALLGESRGQLLRPGLRAHLQVLATASMHGPEAALHQLDGAAPPQAPPQETWLELDRMWLVWRLRHWDALDLQVRRIVDWRPEVGPHLRHVGLVGAAAEKRDAFTLWGESHRGNPQVATLLRESARLRAANADVTECQEILRWSAVLSLDLCDYWLAIGDQHDLEARDADAESAFRAAVRADAHRVQPYIKLGLLYAACGRPQEAIRELQHAATLQPGYADVRYTLGLLLEDLGQIEAAEGQLRTALDLHPGYTMARLGLGMLLAAERRELEAVKHLEIVRKEGITSRDLENHLASIYERLDRADDAARARQRALALADPSDD